MTYRCSQPSTEKIQQNTRLPYNQGADTNYCIIIRYNNKCVCVCVCAIRMLFKDCY